MSRVKVVYAGKLAGSSQTWSMGINFTTPVGSTDNITMNALALSMDNAFRTNFWTAKWANHMHTSDTLESCNAYFYAGAGGHAVNQGRSTNALLNGTGATLPNAPQVACVVTFTTGGAGRSSRGRIYVPLRICADLSGNGRITAALLTTLTGYVKAWLDASNALTLSGSSLRAEVSSTHTVLSTIVNVSADDIADTQRSRRNKFLRTATATATLA